jgi:tellurite resistance protein
VTAKPLFDPSTPSPTTLSPWEGVAAVGVLMMTADEDTAPEEKDELMAFLDQQGVPPETAQAAIHKALHVLAQEGVAALGGSACRALAHTPQAELALQLAVRMALADGFVLIEENTMLLDLARGLGVNEARLEPIIQAELARDERFRSQEELPE